MSRIFMSHSSLDSRKAVALKNWLVDQSPPLANEIFLDIDPEHGLIPGERWKVALKRANTRCEAVICLLSENWATSHECKVEYRLAENLNKQVLCARLEPSGADDLSSEWQRCDLFGEGNATAIDIGDGEPVRFSTEGLYRLRDAVRGTGIGADSFVWPPPGDADRAPYRGWEPFEQQDAAVFFGRDAALVRAVDQLRGVRQSGAESLFVVLGPSGTGKSSFLRAGILPRLAREDRRFLVLDIVRPGRNPLSGDTGLAVSIANARNRFGLNEPPLGDIKAACLDDAATVIALLAELQQAAAARLPASDADQEPPAPPTIVIPLDQAEELFAADAGDQATPFFSLVNAITEAGLGPVVVATIRTDRYDVMQTHPAVAALRTVVFDDLKPMPANQFKEVITGPAERATEAGRALSVAPELVDQLMSDAAGGGDALPLLSLTLADLYADYGASGTLTLDHYAAMGGTEHVVQNAIDSVLARDPDTRARQLDALRQAFIPWLATVNPENDQPMRRAARWADLPEASRSLVDAMVEKRLLVRDVRDGEVIVEVALESLLRQWDDLAGWLRDRRQDLLAADELEGAAEAWHANDGDSAWLLIGSRLTDAEALITKPGFRERLSDLAQFLSASREQENERGRAEAQRRESELIAAQERADRAQEQATYAEERQASAEAHGHTLRRRSRITAAVALLAVIVAVAAAVGFVQARQARNDAQHRFLEATSIRLAGESRDVASVNSVESLQMILAANVLQPTPAAIGALSDAVIVNQATDKLIAASQVAVWGVAFSPDGTRLASAGADGTVRLWDATTGQPVGEPLKGGTEIVDSVAFSPDGTRLAAGSRDKMVRLWDTASGQPIGEPLRGHTGEVSSVAFNRDGTRLASGDLDGTIRLWKTADGRPDGEPIIAGDAVYDVAFSPDGARLASAGYDNDVRLWDTATHREVGEPLRGATERVLSVAFSPDGTRIAAGSADKTIRRWETSTGRPIGEPLVGHSNWVYSVAFSPDGKRLASASADKTVRVWDAFTGQPIGDPLRGHTDAVYGVAFSPDGTHLASGSLDDTVRLWDRDIGQPLTGHTNWVNDVAFSPDGARLASASRDGTVRLWDTATGQPVNAPVRGPTSNVSGVAFSPNGTRLLSGGDDGQIRQWDPVTGQAAAPPLDAGYQGVEDIAISPDGTRIATANGDWTIQLWDVATHSPIGKPMSGHTDWINNIAFSPDGTRLASASSDNTIRLWDTATSQPVGEPLTGHTDWVNNVVFSPDGTRLASASSDNTIQLWDTATRRPVGEPLRGHTSGVNGVAFSPDGTRLASAGGDKTVRLWDVASGHPIGEPLVGHGDGVATIAFSHDGTRLASGSWDHTIRLWPGTPSAADLCAKLTRNMSADEWDDWVSPDVEYVKVCPNLPGPS